MKRIMDVFGVALTAYVSGDRTPFYFLAGKDLEQHDLSRYFRGIDTLNPLEKQMISLARGNILDVGCGTANYFPALEKQGSVCGIDISPKVIALARKGGHNCIVKDIFTYRPRKKFDTITLFENNIGMAGSPQRVSLLLKKLKSVLAPGGQILLALSNLDGQEYHIAKVRPVWKENIGAEFSWIILNIQYLKNICVGVGFSVQVKCLSGKDHLVRMTRK